MAGTAVTEVLAELAGFEDPEARAVNEKHGDDHGVNLGKLRAVAKRLKTRLELAREPSDGPDPVIAAAAWAWTAERAHRQHAVPTRCVPAGSVWRAAAQRPAHTNRAPTVRSGGRSVAARAAAGRGAWIRDPAPGYGGHYRGTRRSEPPDHLPRPRTRRGRTRLVVGTGIRAHRPDSVAAPAYPTANRSCALAWFRRPVRCRPRRSVRTPGPVRRADRRAWSGLRRARRRAVRPTGAG